MAIKWDRQAAAITQRDIKKAEAAVGHELPLEYTRFMLRQNGGYPSPSIFEIHGMPKNKYGSAECIYSIRAHNDYDDLLETNANVAQYIPQYSIAIGHTLSGDKILLFVDGPREGQVWFYDWYGKSRNPERRIYFIAETFLAFLNSLRELSPAEEADIEASIAAMDAARPKPKTSTSGPRPLKRRASRTSASKRNRRHTK